MKKIYSAPETMCIKVKISSLMSTSQVQLGGEYNGSSDIESRRRGSWIDDEDEE